MAPHSLPGTKPPAPSIAIIGGGLTGLFTAVLLERAFEQNQSHFGTPDITIFEKSRSVGRLATRYRTDSDSSDSNDSDQAKQWQWVFGAQFFTAKTADFQQFIAPWQGKGVLQPWCARVVTLTPADPAQIDGQPPTVVPKEQWNTQQARYISTPKMTSWGRALAEDLRHTALNFKTRVAPLAQYGQQHKAQKTELFDDAGDSLGHFDWVICTAPNGQAAELMADSGFAKKHNITDVTMQACYTLMLGWPCIDRLPQALAPAAEPAWDVAYVMDSILDRVFIEQHKPAHGALRPSVTIHARNDWSEQHVDEDIQTVKAHLLQAAQQALSWDEHGAPTQIDCHRWRYAATLTDTGASSLGALVDEPRQWIVSGDWCGQGNIESCFEMAQETVQVIIDKEIQTAGAV